MDSSLVSDLVVALMGLCFVLFAPRLARILFYTRGIYLLKDSSPDIANTIEAVFRIAFTLLGIWIAAQSLAGVVSRIRGG